MASTRISFGDPKITIDGQEIDRKNIASFEVMKDIDQPDMASIVLSNFGDSGGKGGGGGGIMDVLASLMELITGPPEGQRFSAKPKGGAELVVKMKVEGGTEEIVFEGQVTGFFPSFDTHLPVTVQVRGMNKMHKFTRERRTRTFVNQTEQQIVSKIIQDNGLTANFGREPPTLLHEHLHQNNQTDLEFLRLRASRTCRECYVEKDTFYFRKRQKDDGPVAELTVDNEDEGAEANPESGGALENFTPEFASAGQVKKVTVHGWDPMGTSREAQQITGKAEAAASPLGGEMGASSFGDQPELHVSDTPGRSREELDLLAKSILEERQMNFITAEAVTLGNAKLKPGCVVKLKTADARFNGKYYVAGAHFSFAEGMTGLGGGKGMGGYKTHLKLKRDAGQGGS